MQVALGLGLGQTEKHKRFGEAARRYRWHRTAHTIMVQATAAKWSGSNREMFEFARRASAEAPEGSDVHVAVPLAHLEQWLNLPRESDDGKDRQLRYFRDGQVGAEILRAADRSVRSPRYQPGPYTPSDRNTFAMCFWLMRDFPAQLEQMRQIGSLVTASPWNYQGDPGWAYERARTRAMEAMGIPGPAGPRRRPWPLILRGMWFAVMAFGILAVAGGDASGGIAFVVIGALGLALSELSLRRRVRHRGGG